MWLYFFWVREAHTVVLVAECEHSGSFALVRNASSSERYRKVRILVRHPCVAFFPP